MERQIAALLCRTSDRGPQAAAGTGELAELLGARVIGSPGEPRSAGYEDDLRDCRGCLLEAGGQVDDALEAGRVPILLAGECSVCVSTLPLVVRRLPDVRVLWLDAHPDFHTPATTGSGYLAGMGLAGACGLWDTGFGAGLDPAPGDHARRARRRRGRARRAGPRRRATGSRIPRSSPAWSSSCTSTST